MPDGDGVQARWQSATYGRRWHVVLMRSVGYTFRRAQGAAEANHKMQLRGCNVSGQHTTPPPPPSPGKRIHAAHAKPGHLHPDLKSLGNL